MATNYAYVQSQLTFSQTTKINPRYFALTSNIEFAQILHNSTPHLFASNLFQDIPLTTIINVGTDNLDALAGLFSQYGIRQSVSVRKSITSHAIRQVFNLKQVSAPNTIIVSAGNHIHFRTQANPATTTFANNSLNIKQTVIVNKTKAAGNTIVLSQTARYTRIATKLETSTLVILSKVSVYKESRRVLPTPLPHRKRVLLRCVDTRLSKTLELELRNPDFNNSEQLEFRRINRRSRGGTLQIYRDSNWPVSRRLVYTFSQLEEASKKALLTFLEDTIGYEVTLIDFESREWLGIITTPSADAQQGHIASNAITLQFEGVLV